ncbi:hypothetical protein [Cellulomonas sp.]|uniref:hypothetical protein n=1 Tax=Cellulomonas sp. TaxID=40001 RepID=UPI003BA902A0
MTSTIDAPTDGRTSSTSPPPPVSMPLAASTPWCTGSTSGRCSSSSTSGSCTVSERTGPET